MSSRRYEVLDKRSQARPEIEHLLQVTGGRSVLAKLDLGVDHHGERIGGEWIRGVCRQAESQSLGEVVTGQGEHSERRHGPGITGSKLLGLTENPFRRRVERRVANLGRPLQVGNPEALPRSGVRGVDRHLVFEDGDGLHQRCGGRRDGSTWFGSGGEEPTDRQTGQ